MYEPIHGEEPVRFSPAPPEPLPVGLLVHTRHAFGSTCGKITERSPAVPGLQMLLLFGVAGSDASALERLKDELRGPALALGIDCALARGRITKRGPRPIASDMNSTFIRGGAIDMLADTAGSGLRMVAITKAAMNSELGLVEAFVEHVTTLEGLSVDRVESTADRTELVPRAETLVATAHTRGHAVDLVSGGFIEVIEGPARRLGVDCVLANRLETSDNALTGRTEGGIVTHGRETEVLRRWSEGGRLSGVNLPGGSDSPKGPNSPEDPAPPLEARGREGAGVRSHGFPSPHEGINLSETVAAGDGADDLSMMEITGPSVTMCVKSAALTATDVTTTRLRLDILTAILGWDAV